MKHLAIINRPAFERGAWRHREVGRPRRSAAQCPSIFRGASVTSPTPAHACTAGAVCCASFNLTGTSARHALIVGLMIWASIADHAPLKDLDGGMHTPVDTEVHLFSSNLAAHGERIGELKRTLASQVMGLRCPSVPCSFSTTMPHSGYDTVAGRVSTADRRWNAGFG